MEFSAPSSGTMLKPADVEGHILVVEPAEYVANMTTAFGESDAVRVTVHDITDKETYPDVLWFSSALVGSLKGNIGKRVLGVMGKGTAKAGQSAPWILKDASGEPAIVEAATAYLTGQVSASMTAPAPAPAAAPVQDELAAALGNLSGITK